MEKQKRTAYDECIRLKLGTSFALPSALAQLNDSNATDAEKWPWIIDKLESELTFDLIGE